MTLNNDGFFSGSEINDGQAQAMHNLISDTGRNFSFIVGFVFSLVLSVVLFVVSLVTVKIRKHFFLRHK